MFKGEKKEFEIFRAISFFLSFFLFFQNSAAKSLLPPRGRASAEIGLGPGLEHHGVGRVNLSVSDGERKRGRTTGDLAVLIILRAVAWALVLLLRKVPRNDAAQMGAGGVDSERLDLLIITCNEPVRITLQALHELALTGASLLKELRGLDIISERVLRGQSTAGTARLRRHEKARVQAEANSGRRADGTREKKVHGSALGHVRHHRVRGRHRDARVARLARCAARRRRARAQKAARPYKRHSCSHNNPPPLLAES
mmetsp:Transcript_14545/g.38911  ORF Transcript_14545/g.38911 Transcript_14545/m.38911 type:complete len:256 (-) Transcript_14545:16-783(-)